VGLRWTAKISLGSRAEIVRQYRQMHPAEIDGLKKWIGASDPQNTGVKSIAIACFDRYAGRDKRSGYAPGFAVGGTR
jgi:hypothetical protein